MKSETMGKMMFQVIKWDELSELDKNHLQAVYHRLKISCQHVES